MGIGKCIRHRSFYYMILYIAHFSINSGPSSRMVIAEQRPSLSADAPAGC